MSRAICHFSLCTLCAIATIALAQDDSSSKIEVLYQAETIDQHVLLTTFNVNPTTAIARLVGIPLIIASPQIVPLTVEKKHVIYVWNSKGVWTYRTDSRGVPQRQPSQHLRFTFPQPVTTFVADPNGKFAYAATFWVNSKQEDLAAIFLFTIDGTGMLTNTHTVAGRWGPILNSPLTGFYFGKSGARLYANEYDYEPPYSCSPGVLEYPVDAQTGRLGIAITWFGLGASCSSTWAIASDDTLSGYAINWGGAGNGNVEIFSAEGIVLCEPDMLAFCGGTPKAISFDPAHQNLFYSDADTNETYVGHMLLSRFGAGVQGKLVGTSTSIPGTPPIYFSPDSALVYAVNACDIAIHTFEFSTGDLESATSIPNSCNVTVATTTLEP